MLDAPAPVQAVLEGEEECSLHFQSQHVFFFCMGYVSNKAEPRVEGVGLENASGVARGKRDKKCFSDSFEAVRVLKMYGWAHHLQGRIEDLQTSPNLPKASSLYNPLSDPKQGSKVAAELIKCRHCRQEIRCRELRAARLYLGLRAFSSALLYCSPLLSMLAVLTMMYLQAGARLLGWGFECSKASVLQPADCWNPMLLLGGWKMENLATMTMTCCRASRTRNSQQSACS